MNAVESADHLKEKKNKPLQIEDSQLSSCSWHSPGCSSDPRIGACATNIKQESYHLGHVLRELTPLSDTQPSLQT